MAPKVNPIREGYHTAIPSIVVRNAAKAIEFYGKALGAKETNRMHGPDGQSILHSELKIGDSIVFIADEDPGMAVKSPETLKGVTGAIHLNVENTDVAFQRAVTAGAKPVMPPSDMFWGDRYAQITDPYGHLWGLGTHKEDLTPEEIGTRARAFFAQMASRGAGPYGEPR